METMIDRIASCIRGGSTFSQEERVDIAKAILSKMIDSTDAMDEAVEKHDKECYCYGEEMPAHVVFSVMIEAALKGA